MRVVFHHSSDDAEMHARVVNNVANLLADETVDVEAVAVVVNGGGLGLLVGGTDHRELIESLQERNVLFKQCENTLARSDWEETDLLDGVEIVSSGVGELARLQSEGYAYIKP